MSSGLDFLATVCGHSEAGHVIAQVEIGRSWASGDSPGPIMARQLRADREIPDSEVEVFRGYARGLSACITAQSCIPDERPFICKHSGIVRTEVRIPVGFNGMQQAVLIVHSDGDVFVKAHQREYPIDRDESRIPFDVKAFRFARNLWRELGFDVIGSGGAARFCGSHRPEDHALWEARDRIFYAL